MNKRKSRYFIGLDLSPRDKVTLLEWRNKYLRGLPDSPVPAENFHITLSFLGHVDEKKHEYLMANLESIKAKPFTLAATELAHFSRASILYMGVSCPEPLLQLATQCQGINKKLGLAPVKSPYIPHITLTRKHKNLTPLLTPTPNLELQFSQFHLFESVSSHEAGTPPHYPIRASFDLHANANPSYNKLEQK